MTSREESNISSAEGEFNLNYVGNPAEIGFGKGKTVNSVGLGAGHGGWGGGPSPNFGGDPTVMDIGLEICWKLALEFLITFRIAHSKFPSVVILILVPFVSSAV
jgi:hypothetical protein